MIGRVRRVAALPAAERRRLAEAVLALAVVKLVLGLLPFRLAMRCLGLTLGKPSSSGLSSAEALAVGGAVNRVAGHMPFRAVCLQQALAAALMLRRRGLPAEVHFGLARADDGRLHGHAWCLSAGTAVTGVRHAGKFAPVAVYGN
jgi:hypothetical protein